MQLQMYNNKVYLIFKQFFLGMLQVQVHLHHQNLLQNAELSDKSKWFPMAINIADWDVYWSPNIFSTSKSYIGTNNSKLTTDITEL